MRRKGHTITEYGLIIGLVCLVCPAALSLLGNATSATLSGIGEGNAQMSSLMGLVSSPTSISNGSVRLQGSGYYVMTIDPRTGLPVARISTSTEGASNTTSVEGDQWNLLGQFQLAKTLDTLAAQQSDPNVAAYIEKLAKASYYLGAAEGELDGVPSLELGDAYGKIEAYQDLKRFKSEITSLLQNPPTGIDAATMTEVSALSVDVYNIANTYTNNLAPLMEGATSDFLFPWTQSTLGGGKPGGATTLDVGRAVTFDSAPDSTIEEIFSYQAVKDVASSVMEGYQASTEPVKATFTDAIDIDTQAAL